MTTFYVLRFETPPTWWAKSPYLYPPGIGWPSGTRFLSVASYVSQGYCGIMWTRLTMGVFLLFVRWDFGYSGHYWPIVPAPDDRLWWFWRNWWNEYWQGKPKYSEKTCPSATLSTTNPTWLDPGLNPGRCYGKTATNRLSYGAALPNGFTCDMARCKWHYNFGSDNRENFTSSSSLFLNLLPFCVCKSVCVTPLSFSGNDWVNTLPWQRIGTQQYKIGWICHFLFDPSSVKGK
jgi:hypothetical protein